MEVALSAFCVLRDRVLAGMAVASWPDASVPLRDRVLAGMAVASLTPRFAFLFTRVPLFRGVAFAQMLLLPWVLLGVWRRSLAAPAWLSSLPHCHARGHCQSERT